MGETPGFTVTTNDASSPVIINDDPPADANTAKPEKAAKPPSVAKGETHADTP
jgi:hypothetical protein